MLLSAFLWYKKIFALWYFVRHECRDKNLLCVCEVVYCPWRKKASHTLRFEGHFIYIYDWKKRTCPVVKNIHL